MKVVYISILTRLNRVIFDAKSSYREIEEIQLTQREWAEFCIQWLPPAALMQLATPVMYRGVRIWKEKP